jgi:hypothetical protein
VAPVTAVTNANLAGVLGGTNLTVTVTASLPTGWSYLQFGDPGPGAYQLAHVFRTDHSEVPLGTNVWTTDRNFIGGDVVPVHTNLVHLLDYNSTGSYTLVYAPVVTNTVDTNPPTSLVSALPAASAPTFTVQWSGSDNSGGSGLGFFDIYASTNGGPFGPWIQGTKQTAAVFNGTASTTYAFFSRATDLAGNQEPLHSTPDAHTATTVPANTPPVIAPIATQSLVEGSLFSFTPSATDAQTGITLTWNLLTGAPAGALIAPQTGHITWQTGAGDAGTTNQFVLVVTDNGSPSLSATQAFEVVVARLNHAPVIVPTASQYVVSPGSNLMVQLSANDSDFPQQTLTWQLSGKVPAGLNLGAATGLLAWTPQPSQANTTNLITVTVSDNGTPSLSASETFSIIVVSGNHAPSLAAIGNQSINVLQQLIFTNSATDSDRPAQVLTFSLDPGSPAGTFIDPDTGVFSWVPSLAQAHNTNAITVRVTDSGSPALSDAETFTVVVGDYLEILLGTTVLQAGESGTVTVSMNTTIPVTNVNFTLTVPEANLTNLAFGSPLPSLRSALLTRTGPGQYLGSFVVANSQGLTGTQVLASLDFTARADSPSALVPLAISAASAQQLNGAVMPVVLSQNNRVAVVNNIPLLDALGVAGQFQLTVYAPPGIQYTVESTPNFIPPLIWTPLYSGTIGSGSYESIPIPITNSSRFFRIIEK